MHEQIHLSELRGGDSARGKAEPFPGPFTGTNHRSRDQAAIELPVSSCVYMVLATILGNMLAHGARPLRSEEANPLQYSHPVNS